MQASDVCFRYLTHTPPVALPSANADLAGIGKGGGQMNGVRFSRRPMLRLMTVPYPVCEQVVAAMVMMVACHLDSKGSPFFDSCLSS